MSMGEFGALLPGEHKERALNGTRWITRCACLLLMMLLPVCAAMGESARGDLAGRFADVPQVECGGETYYLRSRLTAIMAAGILPDAQDGAPRAEFVAVFAIDDGEKRITPIRIDGQTLVEFAGETLPLRDVFAQDGEPEERCLRLRAAVDALLGGGLIVDYAAVDLDGITAVDAFSHLAGDARERLRQLRMTVKDTPARELYALYGEIGDCLITNMKSGAVMRSLDKSERYEIAEAAELPVLPARTGGDAPEPDAEGIQKLVIDVFYAEALF